MVQHGTSMKTLRLLAKLPRLRQVLHAPSLRYQTQLALSPYPPH